MCNLYRMTKAPDEVARLFNVRLGQFGNAGGDVYPGYPGLVVAGGQLRSTVCIQHRGAFASVLQRAHNRRRADAFNPASVSRVTGSH